jgi:hypothetical protein
VKKFDELSQGAIYWLDRCPSALGSGQKRRPVIVFSPNQVLAASPPEIIVVAVSTSATESASPDRIPLPNLRDNPGCSTGLPLPCWAVPSWYFKIAMSRLKPDEKSGYLNTKLTERLVVAVLKHMPPLVE